MKGKLCKTSIGWEVSYVDEMNIQKSLPLHPTNVKQIEQDALVFDNIEARIQAWPDVDFFPIIDANINTTTNWAKLIERMETIEVSKRDLELILNAIENPPVPNDELKKAVEKYKNKLG